MYKYVSLILLLGASLIARATTVTATITDSDTQTWNNGTYAISLVNPRPDITPNVNGTALTSGQLKLTGSLSGGGALSVTLVDSTTISPVGTTWSFTICPNASSACGTGASIVQGSSQSLTVFLNSIISAPRFSAISGSYGYRDAEVAVIPSNGAMYYNVTTGLRICALSGGVCTWSAVGGGGSPYNPAAVAITGGTVGGTTSINTSGPIATTGVITAGGCDESAVYAFGSATTTGFGGCGRMNFFNVGSLVESWTSTGQVYGANYGVLFSPNPNPAAADADTGISRLGVGAVGVGNGTIADFSATLQSGVVNTDPGCTTTAHIGKLWFDTTTTTTVLKVCMNVAGTLTWVTK